MLEIFPDGELLHIRDNGKTISLTLEEAVELEDWLVENHVEDYREPK